MKIAVVLLTCDRYDYTSKTVESLLAHNDASDWGLYYADDASTDSRIRWYVESRGFVPLVLHDERKGCSPTTEELISEVRKHVSGETPLLYLQNDFESVRPMPLAEINEQLTRDDVIFVQFTYRRPRNRYNRSLKWFWPDGQPWGFGDTTKGEFVYTEAGGGLGYHPAVAAIETWTAAAANALKEKDFRNAVIRMQQKVCRTTRPVFRHIGHLSTPGGLYGKRRKRRRQRLGAASYETKPATPEPERAVCNRNKMQLGASAYTYLAKILRPGMRTLECGSGLSTWLFFGIGCQHTSLEDKAKFAPPLPGVLIRPLTGTPPWFDWEPDGVFDVILIDGPPGGKRRRRPGRDGILRVIDRIVHPQTVILLDDTDRRRDRRLAQAISKRLGMSRRDFPAEHPLDFRKQFTVLTPRAQQ